MYRYIIIGCISMIYAACGIPALTGRTENKAVPARYGSQEDTLNTAHVRWKDFFADPYLSAIIDTALQNNQELNIALQEIEMARNEARASKGEYLPFVGLRGGAGVEKVGRYTSQGANDANTDIKPGKEMPEPLPDYMVAAYATWEVDVWHKLRNARKAAVTRYLSTIEGRNFLVTNLIAEIAGSYYELLALDNQLNIVKQNIGIQNNALEIVKLQKDATRTTELAVRKFEAEVLHTRSLQYDIQQQITETENRINFLAGRYPAPIPRNDRQFGNNIPAAIHAGLPSQLLANRPDIKQAELELAAARLDVQVARARFYPSLGISAAIGYRAFNPAYLVKTPESLLYSLTGDLVAPVVNRNAIKAAYSNANARQMKAVYNYERTVLNAYVEVANQLSKIGNLSKRYELKAQQVAALTQSITISNDLFKSARADYMEVLMTQRDALESKFELIETQKEQLGAMVRIYRALGGGWN
ncbi:TolC family protein [Chitinophaga alhagiae]|uniref:TolC family protein n=1 Tax=Chitinophaga alhagiae TaxID=2203219 RepID=UPI001E33ABCD|nr:efflux transporter outer membrane subunit [Chitinophaga alhagiae]